MYVKSKLHEQMQPSWVSHHAYMNFHQRFWRQGTKNYTAMLTAGYAVGEFMENIGGIVRKLLLTIYMHKNFVVAWDQYS